MGHNVTSDLWTYSNADWVYQAEKVVIGVLSFSFFPFLYFHSLFWGEGVVRVMVVG